ncbi:MFS transporter [Streptomyces sp. NPDC003077]|uniref:MFS transporter n=1 Tax=Streptomyces sp. NPDC003077 TaxID=3154443 RepID=UPI0033BEBF8C
MIVALDGTVLTVAQPTLQRDLNATFVQVQWTSTGYLIAVASLLVFAGRLGDRYGHQRVFALGILGFGATSAGIGFAPGVGWVIGLRVAQGVFGALLQPATLGMLRAAYPPDRLGMPIALRTSAIGLAAAAGPVVGGALAAHLGWRAVFFLNVAPALLIGVAALVVRGPVRGPVASVRLDLPGAGLLAAALVCVVHTLTGMSGEGWTVASAFGLAASVACGAAFARHIRRAAHPLVPADVLRSATVLSALGLLVSASAAMFGTLFVGTYFLQDVLGLDPLQSGLRALPLAVMMVLGAPVSAVLLRRYGPRRTAAGGALLVVLGVALFSRLDEASSSVVISGCFFLLGGGFGAVMVTATAVVVRHVSAENAGVAGGLQQTAMNIGPTLGVAAATMLMALMTHDSVANGPRGDGARWASASFVAGMGPTLAVLGAVALAGALLAAKLPRPATTSPPDGHQELSGTHHESSGTHQEPSGTR